ncbi:MAG: hypothetical protein ACXABG_11565 [Promethearchaeota archaeon]|jgi:hypothetical protein
MNKKKVVKKSLILATIGILALSLIPAANAGFPGHFRDRPYWNNLLMPWFTGDYTWEFSTSEDLFFRVGWATWWEEIENDWAPKWPYQFKLFINDEEITLQRYEIPVAKEDKEIVAKISYWYHVFGPDFFTPGGEYLLRFEFWVRRPYQGDGKNYWRIFVDYDGIFFPPGTELWDEFYLNIVA